MAKRTEFFFPHGFSDLFVFVRCVADKVHRALYVVDLSFVTCRIRNRNAQYFLINVLLRMETDGLGYDVIVLMI